MRIGGLIGWYAAITDRDCEENHHLLCEILHECDIKLFTKSSARVNVKILVPYKYLLTGGVLIRKLVEILIASHSK